MLLFVVLIPENNPKNQDIIKQTNMQLKQISKLQQTQTNKTGKPNIPREITLK